MSDDPLDRLERLEADATESPWSYPPGAASTADNDVRGQGHRRAGGRRMSVYDDARRIVAYAESGDAEAPVAQALLDLVDKAERGHSSVCRRDLARRGPLRLDSPTCVLCATLRRIREETT